MPEPRRRARSEATKAAIIEAALDLFREQGYEQATMRAIAARAGVSVGNAYYYFASKEHLIQAFYDRAQVEHAAAAADTLRTTTDLTERITGVVSAWIDVMEPYRAFAATFFKHASDPRSPLSPFSPESGPARETAIALWRQVVTGSQPRLPRNLQDRGPELLWLYFMGLVLFWVHDQSDDAGRTRLMTTRTAPMLVRALGLARLPVIRATVNDLLHLVADLQSI